MTLNGKFLEAVRVHMPQVDLEELPRRIAPIDIDARYTSACMTVSDMREFGTTAQLRDAQRVLNDISAERKDISDFRYFGTFDRVKAWPRAVITDR